MTDPNVQTNESGEEVILEPGDPGYVEPGQTPEEGEPKGQQTVTGEPIQEGEAVGPDEPLGGPGLIGEDLTHTRDPKESDAEYLARTRSVVVESASPTDIVPNTPQISMGPRTPVEGREGELSYASNQPEGAPSVVDDEDEMELEEDEEPGEVEEEETVTEEEAEETQA